MSAYNPPDPTQPQAGSRPPVAPGPAGYQQGASYDQNAPQSSPPLNGATAYGAPGYGAPAQEQGQSYQTTSGGMEQLGSQFSNMNFGQDGQGTVVRKKKGRHAYHTLNAPSASFSAAPATSPGGVAPGDQFGAHPGAHPGAQQWGQQPQGQPTAAGAQPAAGMAPQAPTAPTGTPASSAQGKVDPEQIPSIPWNRDVQAQYYLNRAYPTMESHLPPTAAVPYVAVDQGNASPKFARLTLNNIPASSETLNSIGLPLGLILQPLARLQDGEQPVPLVDFGEAGPPRCRRCRAYINPFMSFRSGGNKFVCNMCTHPNDCPTEYFAPTDPSGARVDRLQRPELMLGTYEFAAPKEYWTKQPVPLRWLFLIDVSMESISKGFLDSFCKGLLYALYGDEESEQPTDSAANGEIKSKLPAGALIGIATFDKEAHFYNLRPGLEQAQMVVMPDIEDPFVPISDGMFADPTASKALIKSLLSSLPQMFGRVKNPEPALLPALLASLESLKATGGKIVCSLASLPTWGPGRLFLREKPEMRETEAEKKLFTTEHPGFTKLAKDLTEHGVGLDYFLAAPQGGYLDIATIGHASATTGGEVYYYPNFHAPRDVWRLSKELSHAITRETGFQALMKVRCSNGLQVASYAGNFIQHTLGADLEFGSIDADKAVGVTFSYDGKLDARLDAHFQTALLYTSAAGQRKVRCINLVASVTEGAIDGTKLVDQDAVVGLLAKQALMRVPQSQLKDIRGTITEKTIDILSGYRKNFSGSHPPGQLVLPENLKELAMFMLGLIKSRALKAGQEPTDRRVYDMRLIRSMGLLELGLYLYPRVIAIHNLGESDGFPNENGHLRMPQSVRASYSQVDEGGAYIVDCGQICLLWIHAHVSPNLLEDLFGQGKNSLQALDPLMSSLPVLETHLNAQVRNILQYLETCRGSKALTIQLARQGLDGAEYEFARLLFEDRNNDAQSYVDWLVHLHRHIQMELQGQRKKEESEKSDPLATFRHLW